MMSWFSCLHCFLLINIIIIIIIFPFARSHGLCRSDESAALIEFRSSFSVDDYEYSSSKCQNSFGVARPNSTATWHAGNCCEWEGVTCEGGHVIGLDLRCGGLRGPLGPNSTLFSLARLRTLTLSGNDFLGSEITARFGEFRRMVRLDLSNSNLKGRVPAELAYLSGLVSLDLRRNRDLRLDSSSLRRIVSNLTRLEALVLSNTNMSNVMPDSFANLSTSLVSLDLGKSGLSGEFPEKIFNLKNLRGLHLDNNKDLFGSFPKYNWTSSLRNLGLSNTRFTIDLDYLTRSLSNLTVLFVNECNFTGSFPTLLLKVTEITTLGIASNNFSGRIPWQDLNLENLTYLDLSSNNFFGQLPEICGKFLCDPSNNQSLGNVPMNLKSLLLSHNSLDGKIPSWIYSLPDLQVLSLSHNQFSGQINEFQVYSLAVLQLRSNKLEGPIPVSIFEQKNLYYLDLCSNNLSGVVTFERVSKLKYLQLLCLSFNKLTLVSTNLSNNYTLPKTLTTLRLSSCNITEFPLSLRSAQHLGTLDLSLNRIQGSVPEWLWDVGKHSLYNLNISNNQLTKMDRIPWQSLQLLDLDSNLLQGQLPIPPLSTILYSVAKNQFFGEIPSWVCNLSSIEVLNLSHNRLSGSIPPCIGNFSDFLSVLDLRMNSFRGPIPQNFAKGNPLMTLNLNGNRLEGPLPRSLLNCESLQVLDLGNNSLTGSFPGWLESFSELRVLILRSNRFHGPVIGRTKNPNPFKKLRILDLSNNSFSGLLPKNYFEGFDAMKTSHARNLEYMEKHVLGGYFYRDSVSVVIKGFYAELVKIQTEFITIDCSRNSFVGEIPEVVGDLHALKGLNLTRNKLTGSIPASLGNLTNLESLDLSSNWLEGKIPVELASKLTQLEFLNLSWNDLEGEIPRGTQFCTFKEDAFSGNPKLCGFPLSKSCVEAKREEDDHSHDISCWEVVMMGFGGGLVIGISVGYMVFFNQRFDYWLVEMLEGGWRKYAKFCLLC